MLENFLAALRTFVLVPLLFLYTMVLAIAVVIVVAIDPKTKTQDRIVEHWANLFLAIPPVRVTVEGIDNVDPGQRYVVASNHLSMFDIPLLFRVLPIHGRFLSKKEVFRYPVIGQGMRAIGIIEIDRDSSGSSRAAINAGVEIAAQRGYSLLVFPEGTRSRDGELLPFKRGAFRIAIDTGLPLLPVVIEGTDRISTPGSKVFHAGSVVVRILPPIVTSDMTNKDDLRPFANAVETEMGTVYEAMHRARQS